MAACSRGAAGAGCAGSVTSVIVARRCASARLCGVRGTRGARMQERVRRACVCMSRRRCDTPAAPRVAHAPVAQVAQRPRLRPRAAARRGVRASVAEQRLDLAPRSDTRWTLIDGWRAPAGSPAAGVWRAWPACSRAAARQPQRSAASRARTQRWLQQAWHDPAQHHPRWPKTVPGARWMDSRCSTRGAASPPSMACTACLGAPASHKRARSRGEVRAEGSWCSVSPDKSAHFASTPE
jgi:hypothetical protein